MLNALVAAITAVIFAVTYVSLEDTFVIVALVEVVGAGDLAAIVFIRVVVAVFGAIAAPGDRYTDAG